MDFVIRVRCRGCHRHCPQCLPPRPERGADPFCAGMDFHPAAGRRLEDGGLAQARLVAEDDPVGCIGPSPDHSRGPARRFRGSKNMAPSRERARGDQRGEGDMENSPSWIESGLDVCRLWRKDGLSRLPDDESSRRGKKSKAAYVAALLVSSVLFGYGHYCKGPPGILQSAVSGLNLGSAYLLLKRNLWVSIVGHGCADTIAIVAVFFGLAD